jgi:hypothetical protein
LLAWLGAPLARWSTVGRRPAEGEPEDLPHLKLWLSESAPTAGAVEPAPVEAVAFHQARQASELGLVPGCALDLAVTLEADPRGGAEAVQLKVRWLRPSQAQAASSPDSGRAADAEVAAAASPGLRP